jgi:PAS domain S-box-containing protein
MLEYEEPQSTPDGGLIWLRTSKVPLFDTTGEVMGVLGTYQDITEWRQAQEELSESQRALTTLMSNLPGMVYRCKDDPDWTMEFVSEGSRELTGYRPEDLIDNRVVSYGSLIHPDDQSIVMHGVKEGLARHAAFRLIYRIRSHKGAVKWVWEQGRGVFDDNGNLVAIEGFIADITSQKRAEDAMRESEEKYRMIVQSQTELVVKVDAHGRFLYVSPSYCDVFGKTEEQLLGSRFMPLVHPDDRDAAMRTFKRCFRPPYTCQIEQRAQTRSGWRWLAWSHKAVLDDQSNVAAIVSVARDVTERKDAEQEIRDRMEREHLLRRELDHRVRNNLASLITLIDLAGQTARDAASCAASMRERAQTMAIMHALLSQTGGRPVSLDALINALIPDGCLGTIRSDGPDVGIDADQGQKLGMVINELMTNSVKYGALSEKGGTVDIAWTRSEEDGEQRLTLTWHESGGPPIESEPTSGVGTGLVEGLMKTDLRGRVELTYPRDGARHRMEMTLEEPAITDVAPAAELTPQESG